MTKRPIRIAGAVVPATLSGFFQNIATARPCLQRRAQVVVVISFWRFFVDDKSEVCLVVGDLQMIKVRRKKHHWMRRGVIEQQVGTWR